MAKRWNLVLSFSAQERTVAEDVFKLIFRLLDNEVTQGVEMETLTLRPERSAS